MTFRSRKHKYGNKKTDGYDSKREASAAKNLIALEKSGAISNLKFQVRYELIPKQGKMRAAYYIADFVYEEDGKTVVADAKGFKTKEYILKKKIMMWRYGIEVLEI